MAHEFYGMLGFIGMLWIECFYIHSIQIYLNMVYLRQHFVTAHHFLEETNELTFEIRRAVTLPVSRFTIVFRGSMKMDRINNKSIKNSHFLGSFSTFLVAWIANSYFFHEANIVTVVRSVACSLWKSDSARTRYNDTTKAGSSGISLFSQQFSPFFEHFKRLY